MPRPQKVLLEGWVTCVDFIPTEDPEEADQEASRANASYEHFLLEHEEFTSSPYKWMFYKNLAENSLGAPERKAPRDTPEEKTKKSALTSRATYKNNAVQEMEKLLERRPRVQASPHKWMFQALASRGKNEHPLTGQPSRAKKKGKKKHREQEKQQLTMTQSLMRRLDLDGGGTLSQQEMDNAIAADLGREGPGARKGQPCAPGLGTY